MFNRKKFDRIKYEEAKNKLYERQKEWFGFEMDAWDKAFFGPRYLDKELEKIVTEISEDKTIKLLGTLPLIPVGILHTHRENATPEVNIYEYYGYYKDRIQYIAFDYKFDNLLYACSQSIANQVFEEMNGDTSDETFTRNARVFISQFHRFDKHLEYLIIEQVEKSLKDGNRNSRHRRENTGGDFSQFAANQWHEMQRLFIVGHEYAHLLLGHLDSKRLVSLNHLYDYRQSGDYNLGHLNLSQKEELDADRLGFQIVFNIINKDKGLPNRERILSFLGLDLFFAILDIIDIFEVHTESTHPTGRTRKIQWKKYLEEKLSRMDSARDITQISLQIGRFIVRANGYFRSVIMHEEGYRSKT